MGLNIAREIREMKEMTVPELHEKYRMVFGEECRSRHKQFLLRRIAWRLQAIEEGDLSERARLRAKELANDADLRLRAPSAITGAANPERTAVRPFSASHDQGLPMPGTILTREYRGGMVQVMVLDKEFEYEGEVYRSLTAVAKAVTGSHCNGRAFFGIKKTGGKN